MPNRVRRAAARWSSITGGRTTSTATRTSRRCWRQEVTERSCRTYAATERRFLSPDTFRNGQQAALAADIVALMDVLAIDKAIRRPSSPADSYPGTAVS
jgi:hypothetical protein